MMILQPKFIFRQYLAMTGNTGIFDENHGHSGCNFVAEMAEFWISRMVYNEATGQYDIREVMGPDEYHANITNNVYTNIIAAMAVNFANFSQCVAACDSIPDEWVEMSRKLALEYDEEDDYHPQYQGYTEGTVIKQADTVLAGYPLMYNMKTSTRRNDLEKYESVTDPGGPAMTWGMFAVGYLELGDTDRAVELFQRSYQPYYHHPFYMWTENVNGTGAINFLTGMGGFLQGIMFGYFGIRTRLDKLEFNPVLPEDITEMKLTGVDYYSNEFDVKVSQEEIVMDFYKVENQVVVVHGESEELFVGSPITIRLPRQRFYIKPNIDNFLRTCHLPDDTIGY